MASATSKLGLGLVNAAAAGYKGTSPSKFALLRGQVISTKMDKTAVVQTLRLRKHPKYGKYVRIRDRFPIHDELNECRIGDMVAFQYAGKNISHTKKYNLVDIYRPENYISREAPTRLTPLESDLPSAGERRFQGTPFDTRLVTQDFA
jgi:small subunit ribosomal protein S17